MQVKAQEAGSTNNFNIKLQNQNVKPSEKDGDQNKAFTFKKTSIEKKGSTINFRNRNNNTKKLNKSVETNLKNLVLVIDGNSLEKIIYDSYLKQHFLFLCYAVNSVIGYNFSQMLKAKFTHLLKKS